jgi:16S rRNA (cytosine1402-N4)-methyltransferase
MEHPSREEHVPVLLREVVEGLNLRPGMKVVDGTLGGGGYAQVFLEAVTPGGQVLALDWDQAAIDRFVALAAADVRLSEALREEQLIVRRSSYAELRSILGELGWSAVDAIALDLGLSSVQLSDPARGLSFQTDGPLDMRLNSDERVTAADIVNLWSEEELTDLFRTYGDEGEALRIARAIIATRVRQPFQRTSELAALVSRNVVAARRRARIHPATKVFQALRIAVNSERTHLERFLVALPECLVPHGRVAVVTFHSGEDALVKEMFRREMHSAPPRLGRVGKAVRRPTAEEIRANPRARSAKLRVAERLESPAV